MKLKGGRDNCARGNSNADVVKRYPKIKRFEICFWKCQKISSGTVAIECPSCKGRGCPKCDFNGVQELEIDGRKVAFECPSCKGRGCHKCDYSGVQKLEI